MSRRRNSWGKQFHLEEKAFVGDRCWSDVFQIWQQRMEDFAVELEPLFTVIQVHDPSHPTGRLSVPAWWAAHDISEQHKELQRYFDKHPGTLGPIGEAAPGLKGQQQTIEYLWEARGDPERVAAILISASLFSRMGSARRHYPQGWPPFRYVETLQEWASTQAAPGARFRGWHYSCTDVLPAINQDWDIHIETLHGLVRYLAEEHSMALLQYRPVVVEFVPAPDSFIAKALVIEKAEHERKWKKWREEHEMEMEARRKTEQARLKQHPRSNEWNTLTASELTQLVWSKPVSQLAQEFGVSDVAIGKRCRSLGIPKPPKGFWAKVKAGKLPHPNGCPADEVSGQGENPAKR